MAAPGSTARSLDASLIALNFTRDQILERAARDRAGRSRLKRHLAGSLRRHRHSDAEITSIT